MTEAHPAHSTRPAHIRIERHHVVFGDFHQRMLLEEVRIIVKESPKEEGMGVGDIAYRAPAPRPSFVPPQLDPPVGRLLGAGDSGAHQKQEKSTTQATVHTGTLQVAVEFHSVRHGRNLPSSSARGRFPASREDTRPVRIEVKTTPQSPSSALGRSTRRMVLVSFQSNRSFLAGRLWA